MSAGADYQIERAPGDLPAGSVDNTELALMPAATVKGRALGAGTGAAQDLTAAQVNAIVGSADLSLSNAFIVATQQNESTSFTAMTVNANTTRLYVLLNGDGDIETITPAGGGNPTIGRVVWVYIVGTGVKRVRHAFSGGAGGRLQCPSNRDLLLTNRQWIRLVGDAGNGWLVEGEPALIGSNFASTFNVYVSCPSGGAAGTADDVTVWNANAPFALRILDATLRVSTAVALSSAALRTASGGGGSVVLPDAAIATQTFSTAAVGPFDDVAVATATVAAGGSLFLRRSDRSVVGELILTCIRT